MCVTNFGQWPCRGWWPVVPPHMTLRISNEHFSCRRAMKTHVTYYYFWTTADLPFSSQPMFFSTIENDHVFFQINGGNTNKKSEQWRKWREMAFMWSERGVIRSWSCREVYFEKNGLFFTSLRGKNKISLSNRFRAFLPCFRSLNVLYDAFLRSVPKSRAADWIFEGWNGSHFFY